MDFVPYPKTPRLRRNVTVTEKIDGTNAQVAITAYLHDGGPMDLTHVVATQPQYGGTLALRVGSRNRWITPSKENDNYGFAAWCADNAAELFKLGLGRHFGEWYGAGIQRNYGLSDRRFALFDVHRWANDAVRPRCCGVVPLLYHGDLAGIDRAVEVLRIGGSRAVPGYMQPEGVIVYHTAARQAFKVLLENDEGHKG